MTPELWQQIKQVLAPALELAPEQRAAYVHRACAGNDSLRCEVEKLLADESNVASQFLNETTLASAAASALSEASPWIGRRLGSYQIVEQIGAGGMGEVYRAFRADDQYRKEVALKVVRAGHDSRFVIQRFKNERQILAGLDHPNIARLLDGGTTEGGAPYFVMELIDGQPITDYCDQRKLPIPDRLKLFLKVCAAVQYAHQRLIIHRDIKPGNILVTSDGTPKLLDFGIAKILGFDSPTHTAEVTLTEFRVLTPRYASPEQIRSEPMTTASDVYSLGVVLYELLTGRSPYRLATGSAHEIAQAVCDTEPQRPSSAIQDIGAAAEQWLKPLSADQLSAARDNSPATLRRRLSGDLDNITLMALRKEPARRYASVEQFAEDIRRHLENVPVAARNDTVWYRTSKFVNRHKAGVVAAAAVALSLLAGLAITMHEARIARLERARAEQRFNDVRTLANSLIFDVHDSIKDLPGSTPARKIIVERALQYLNSLAQESTGDIGLQRELANAYEKVGAVQGDYLENNLGDSEGTLASYRKALEIRKQVDAASAGWNDRLALARGYRLVAHQQWATGNIRGARANIERAIAISEDLNPAHPNDSRILDELAFDHEVSGAVGYPDDRFATQKIVEDYRRALAADEIALNIKPDDIHTLYGYATDLSDLGTVLEATDPKRALADYEKALEINRKLTQLSPDLRYQRSVAIAYGSIASVHDDLGDYGHVAENNMKGLAIYQDLNRADPKNALLRQGLAIA